jgi:hypothetical protein
MTQRMTTESLPQWQPGVFLPSNPFLAKTSDLFEQLKVGDACVCLILCSRYLLGIFSAFFQQQVELVIHNTMLREAAEREESRRIAEQFPIEWHSDQSESSESPRSNIEPKTAEPVRTPSPVGKEITCQNASPESPRFPISDIRRSDLARRYSPRKSIFKTPALTFIKEELQAKAGPVKGIKSLRNDFWKLRDLELPQSPSSKCGVCGPFSNQVRFPAPYGLI